MLWLMWKVCYTWIFYQKIQMRSFLKIESLSETRCKKSWDRFDKCFSFILRYVKRVHGKRRDFRWEKQMSKFLISEVLTLWNLRTGPMQRLKDNNDVPEARPGTLPKTFTNTKRKTKLYSARPRKNGHLAALTKELEERDFVVDSGASMHMFSKRDLNSPTTVITANGEVQTREEATVYVKQLDLFVKIMLLEETPAVLSLRKLCEGHGYTYPTEQQSKNNISSKKARESITK